MSIFISRVGKDERGQRIDFRVTENQYLTNYYLTGNDYFGKNKENSLNRLPIIIQSPIFDLKTFFKFPNIDVNADDFITIYRHPASFHPLRREIKHKGRILHAYSFSVDSRHAIWETPFPIIIKYEPIVDRDSQLMIPKS